MIDLNSTLKATFNRFDLCVCQTLSITKIGALVTVLISVILSACSVPSPQGNAFGVKCSQPSRPSLEGRIAVLPPEGCLFLDKRAASLGSFYVDTLGGIAPRIDWRPVNQNSYKVTLRYPLTKPVQQDDLRIDIRPDFDADFHWSPHLTPTDEHIIDQHSFRSPAVIVSNNQQLLTLIPDLDLMLQGSPNRWYMDLDATTDTLSLGMSERQIKEHVLYRKAAGATYPAGEVILGFYIIASENPQKIANPWRDVLAMQWQRWGKALYQQGQPIKGDMLPYVKQTYKWAFENWPAVWQEFELNGKKVGAPQFIVNYSQSPNYTGIAHQREHLSIWNQAWFSSLRSASGVYRYARQTNNGELLQKANLTKELALAFPQQEGLFDSVITVSAKPKEYGHSLEKATAAWKSPVFGNSNRNPYTPDWSLEKSPKHILDMSWTAYLMLQWYEELEQDPRLLKYAIRYADRLLTLQADNGYFPGWVKDDGSPYHHLNESPETSMSVTFLTKLFQLTHEKRYLNAAKKAMAVVMEEIIPNGRWEDFETYWSCSRHNTDVWYGEKISRNNMHKQNNFSIYWTAQALLALYQQTGEPQYLQVGQRTLDELLMTQASWQPPYILIEALGGFGVMNADGEWNDSRQSLFAELIVQYGKILDKEEYLQRGLAAMRSSFIMMYSPKNMVTKALWEKKWPHFNSKDYGFMMENYGHVGHADQRAMGDFTIYDWGNGAASEAYMRMRDHYGEAFINTQ